MSGIYKITSISAEFSSRLRAMPKMEIHVHLEGAMDAETIWKLAQRNTVRLPAATLEDWQAMYAFRDFNHFIEIYKLATEYMHTPDDFTFMIERFLAKQALHNIKYSEVSLSGSFMVEKFSQDEIIAALARGIEIGEEQFHIKLGFIPDITRHMPETRHAVLDLALKGHDQGVFIGLGLGGIEAGFPPVMFTDVFDAARQQGLHSLAHAGESDGAQSVWGAIRDLKVERIGHGIRAVDDPKLLEYLAQTQIPLKISPYSNYRTNVTPYDQPHPIRSLVDAGVFCTVNSDDPGMFSTNLTKEYQLLVQQGFSWEEIWQLNLNSIEASFLSEEEKEEYRKTWRGFYSSDP